MVDQSSCEAFGGRFVICPGGRKERSYSLVPACTIHVPYVKALMWPCSFCPGVARAFLIYLFLVLGRVRNGHEWFWTHFQGEPSILDAIRDIFDDLGPTSCCGGPDLDLLDQGRYWLARNAHLGSDPSPIQQQVCAFCCFCWAGCSQAPYLITLLYRNWKTAVLLKGGGEVWVGLRPPSQSLPWSRRVRLEVKAGSMP